MSGFKGLAFRISLVMVIIVLMVVLAQTQEQEQKDERIGRFINKPGGPPGIFTGNGYVLAKVHGRTRRPKIVVDTVRFSGSKYASLNLNSTFGLGLHSVSATSINNIYVVAIQLLEDSTATVNDYAVYPADQGRRLLIISSNANDSSKVSVIAIIN